MRLSDQTHPLALGGKVVVPVGSFEQHGPHLPLSTDSLIAKAVAEKVAKKISAVVGPSIKIGVSPEHMGFSGTITYTSKTFKAVVTEVVESLKKHGYSQVIIINGHGGNNKSLSEIDLGTTVVNLTTLIKPYDHAGEIETSIMLFAHPDLVRKGKIKKHEYTLPCSSGWDDTRKYSVSGVFGDPTKASAKKGQKILAELVKKTLAAIT